MCGSGVLTLVDKKITPEVQGAKVRAQGAKIRTEGAKVRTSTSNNIQGKGCSNMQHSSTNATITTTTQILYRPLCKVQWLLHRAVLVRVGGGGGGSGSSWMLLLHLLPTCPDAGPDLCTFCPDLCTLRPDPCTLRLWCYSSISTPPTHMVEVTGCNLCWWHFTFSHWQKHSLHWWSLSIHSLAYILHLRSSNLHHVMVYIT